MHQELERFMSRSCTWCLACQGLQLYKICFALSVPRWGQGVCDLVWLQAASQIGNLNPMVLESNPLFLASCSSGWWSSLRTKDAKWLSSSISSPSTLSWDSVQIIHKLQSVHVLQQNRQKNCTHATQLQQCEMLPSSPIISRKAWSLVWVLKTCFCQSSLLLVNLLMSFR